ncbi:MAG: ATP-binding protein [Campylobacterota bacterium]|nr:ATP-binding protein [Campylobacterota bacterium]
MNPFQYQTFCIGETFCSREKEILLLKQYISTGKNVLLYSKRRFGKSSLIKELFENRINKDEYLTIYIDIFDIIQSIDFANITYKAIASSLPSDFKSIMKQLKSMFSKVNFSTTLKNNGELEFKPSISSFDFDELMADIFNGLLEYSTKNNKKLVVVFDEFQQIALIKEKKIDAIIRKYIQEHQNISYIFTGSKRHILTHLFSKYDAPLYEMANHMQLDPIDINVFYEFVNQKLNNRLPFELFEYIYNLCDGESKLIQEFGYHMFFKQDDIMTDEIIEDIYNFILDEKTGHFKMILDRLTIPQKIALKSVTINDGKHLFKKENLFKLQTTKASLNSAIKFLYKDELIDKEDEKYFISNKSFELWCKREFTI